MTAESERRRDDLAALRIDRSAPAARERPRWWGVAWVGGASALFLLLSFLLWRATLGRVHQVEVAYAQLSGQAGAATAAAVLDELLYNKRYSLLWEGGHSWIDFRHYNKLTLLPRMTANGKFFPAMPFPNNECLVRSNAASLAGCAPVPGL